MPIIFAISQLFAAAVFAAFERFRAFLSDIDAAAIFRR